jgi:hypothetical protein
MAEQLTLELYFAVLRVLEQANAPYVIIGAYAGASYGVTRATFDVDIVVDLIPLTMKPSYGWTLDRRVCRRFLARSGETFEAWCARPEDVIVGKLMAWREGRSTKHEWDIRDILAAVRLGEDLNLEQLPCGCTPRNRGFSRNPPKGSSPTRCTRNRKPL